MSSIDKANIFADRWALESVCKVKYKQIKHLNASLWLAPACGAPAPGDGRPGRAP
ncbi:hypothetical protein GCM10027082_22550 [Comamonas humi]